MRAAVPMMPRRPAPIRMAILLMLPLLWGGIKASAGDLTPPPSQVLPSDDEIRKILVERLGAAEPSLGIAVGIIEPRGRRVISFGHRKLGDPRAVDGDTVFEIGSVTKVFTALLLADMVSKKELALSDPVAKYLPNNVKAPERNGRAITLLDLATHTSGLPFMPENAPPFNEPAAARYSASDLRRYVSSYQLTREIGSQWEYSNVGYWLLSEALSARGHQDFEDLLRKRVLLPLKMARTDCKLSAQLKANLAIGHDSGLQPVRGIASVPIYSIMPAAGGLFSTVNDLLTFLSAAMKDQPSSLAPAILTTVTTRRPTSGNSEQALGWTVFSPGSDELIFRDGGTVGYASAIGWDPARRVGIVVLLNQIGAVDDIARHILRSDFPLAQSTVKTHSAITLDPKVLDSYAGQYEAEGEGTFTVIHESDFLTIEAPADWGLPKIRIRPETEHDFFAAELPVRVTFQTESDGRVRGLIIFPPRGQKGVPAKRH